jgi:DnaJ-domain-containing protein 1
MTFGEAWTHSYLLNFNSFQTDSYDNIQWVLFIIATLINPLVLMNMIIALLGNTYGRVKENAVVADLLELAEMIIETESILIWRRSDNNKDYVQICASAEKIEDNEIKDFGAQVKKISTVIPQIKERLLMMVKNNEVGCRHLDNILRKEFDKFDEDLRKLETSMQDDYDFLKSEFTSSLIK